MSKVRYNNNESNRQGKGTCSVSRTGPAGALPKSIVPQPNPQQDLFDYCPKCKKAKVNVNKDCIDTRQKTIIWRHWKPEQDFICGNCFAVFDTGKNFLGFQKDLS